MTDIIPSNLATTSLIAPKFHSLFFILLNQSGTFLVYQIIGETMCISSMTINSFIPLDITLSFTTLMKNNKVTSLVLRVTVAIVPLLYLLSESIILVIMRIFILIPRFIALAEKGDKPAFFVYDTVRLTKKKQFSFQEADFTEITAIAFLPGQENKFLVCAVTFLILSFCLSELDRSS